MIEDLRVPWPVFDFARLMLPVNQPWICLKMRYDFQATLHGKEKLEIRRLALQKDQEQLH